MAKTKYGKYIITKPKPHTVPPDEAPPKDMSGVMTSVVYLDGEVIKGAFYVDCNWFWKENEVSPPPHTHDFDEVLTFFGTNPEDPHDLCGEIELWLDDEKHILTKSCVVFIPKGLKHCPMMVRRADRPIFHFSAGPSGTYAKII